MLWVIALCALVVLLVLLVPRVHLASADLSSFDTPRPEMRRSQPSEESRGIHARVTELVARKGNDPRGSATAVRKTREMLDAIGADADLRGVEIQPVQAGGVASEWVIAEGADPDRRLLYIHGGAFVAGSPRSHRPITSELSRRTGCSVLAIDYRLMPEHPRMAGIEDCRSACLWLTAHGPAGAGHAVDLFVAGDSAGGNLTLSLVAWLRDQGHRQVDGAIALSPSTDSSFTSPSLRTNMDSDPILGPAFAPLRRVPGFALLWFGWINNRIRPNDPRVSPTLGDLSNLPPVLVHASASEMLFDDAVRYVNKNRAAGGSAELHTWPDMVHVWQMFAADLPESDESYAAIAEFVSRQGASGVQRAAS